MKGIEAVQTRYTVKFRSDFGFNSNELLKLLNLDSSLFIAENFEKKLLVLNCYSKFCEFTSSGKIVYNIMMVSDFICVGLTSDIRQYWEGLFDTIHTNYKSGRDAISVESLLALRFFIRKGVISQYPTSRICTEKQSLYYTSLLVKEFIFLEPNACGILTPIRFDFSTRIKKIERLEFLTHKLESSSLELERNQISIALKIKIKFKKILMKYLKFKVY